MINDEIKKAFDSIHADDDLKNKVLALNDVKNRPQRRRINRYIPAAAAAAVVGIAAIVSYPMLTRVQNDKGVLSESMTVSDNAPSNGAHSASSAAASTAAPAADGAMPTAAPAAAPQQRSSRSLTASSTDVPYITTPPRSESAPAEYNPPVYGDIAPAREPDRNYSFDPPYMSEPRQESVTSVPLSPKAAAGDSADTSADTAQAMAVPEMSASTVVLAMNAVQNAPMMAALYRAEEPYDGSLTFAEWTDEDYFAYLGKRIEPELPGDFTAVSGGSSDVSLKADGSPLFDTRAFAFKGSDERYVTVQTSKDTNNVMNYLYDSSYTKSNVDGTAAVLIGETGDCTGYMIKGGIGYVINAQGLSEDELKALLLSIAR